MLENRECLWGQWDDVLAPAQLTCAIVEPVGTEGVLRHGSPGARRPRALVHDCLVLCASSGHCAAVLAARHAELDECQQLLHVCEVRGIAGSHVLNPAAA